MAKPRMRLARWASDLLKSARLPAKRRQAIQSRACFGCRAIARRARVAGIIATNTTIARDGLQSSPEKIKAGGEGGLSGAPLRPASNKVIRKIFRLTTGAMPIVGVGGVFSADDAWEKICAGASLIQLYTGFIYEGPAWCGESTTVCGES